MLKYLFPILFLVACESGYVPESDLAQPDFASVDLAADLPPAPDNQRPVGGLKVPCYQQEWDACNPVPTRNSPASRPVPFSEK